MLNLDRTVDKYFKWKSYHYIYKSFTDFKHGENVSIDIIVIKISLNDVTR